MRASTLAYTVAVACLLVCGANADAGAAPTLQLPGSTGGVPVTLVSLDGTQAFFTNDTFSVFKVDYVSFTVEASLDIDEAVYGIPFYGWFDPSYPTSPFIYYGTSLSHVLKIDTESMELVQTVNVSTYIPSGWGGGYAVDLLHDSVWLTGKYAVVLLNLADLSYKETVVLKSDGQLFEPLCGDLPFLGDQVYFGSAVGNATHGVGGLNLVQSGPVNGTRAQYFVNLGPAMHWPFEVFANANGTQVYVFSTMGVAAVARESLGVLHQVKAKSPMRELMCHTGDRSAAIVSSGEKGWLLWNFDVLPMTVQDNLGAPIVLSSRHSCGMFDAGGTAAVGGEQPGTGLAVVTKVSYTHLPPM